MSEQRPVPDASGSDSPQCPWCSAILPSPDEARCPSCDASLHEIAPDEVPGVTTIDHRALLDRKLGPRTPGFLGWLSGSPPVQADVPEPTAAGTFRPPDDDVRREMVRMEIAAVEASLEADRAFLEAERGIGAGEADTATDLGDALAVPEDPTSDGPAVPEDPPSDGPVPPA